MKRLLPLILASGLTGPACADTVTLEAQPHSTRIVSRPASGESSVLREVGGTKPVTLLEADLRGDGRPEHLAVLQEEGSGAYRRLLLISDDGKTVAWESRPTPGLEAKVVARSFEVKGVLKGEQPEGDLATLSELTWELSGPSFRRKAIAEPRNGWQCLTGGDDAMTRGNWKDAVTLFTRAVDSKEGSSEPLGALARHDLARALLADNQAARARSMLVGLKKRFPDSDWAREAQRTLDLLDSVYKLAYDPAVQLVRAEEAVRSQRFELAEAACQKILAQRGASAFADQAHFLLGQTYEGLGRTKDAVKQFQTLVLYFPSSSLEKLAREEITKLELPGRP